MEGEASVGASPTVERRVIVVGDLLVDELVAGDGTSTCYAGGAGYNTAVDLTDLGIGVDLVATVGDDSFGEQLRADAAARGVRLWSPRSSRPTGVATSWRVDDEPHYSFNAGVTERSWSFTGVGEVPPSWLVVNSYKYGDASAVEALLRFVEHGGHRVVVDPNPRPALIADRRSYLDGVLRVAAVADVVKFSAGDAAVLGTAVDELSERFHAAGVDVVVVTSGGDGASVSVRNGPQTDVAAPTLGAPVVDTMGAGDAVTAGIVTNLIDLPADVSAAPGGGVRDAIDPVLAAVAAAKARVVFEQTDGEPVEDG